MDSSGLIALSEKTEARTLKPQAHWRSSFLVTYPPEYYAHRYLVERLADTKKDFVGNCLNKFSWVLIPKLLKP